MKTVTEELGMEQFLSQTVDAKPGTIVDGTVVSKQDATVLIDIGLKSEASIAAKEFTGPSPDVGQTIPVYIIKLSGPGGRPIVSHRQAKEKKYWDSVAEAHQKNQTVKGKVIQRVKGGLRVDVGLEAFMPTSQLDLKTVYNPEEWVGREVEVKVMEMNRSKGSVVVSRRQVLGEEREVKKSKTLETLKEGQVVKGTVSGMTNFGAFIDIGGVEGLLHISDISWARVDHPQKVLKSGEEIEVKVLKFDTATNKISLGRKQLLAHPLDDFERKFKIGDLIKGKVSSIASFGAFVEIEPGVEGLIHLSEFSWTDRIKSPKDAVQLGQDIEARFIGFDRVKEKISLSLKRIGDNPWEQAAKMYPKGTVLEGEVSHLAPFGVFVKIPLGIEGLIRAQDFSWTENSTDLKNTIKPGQKIKAVVLEINTKLEKMSLGVKQMASDPFQDLRVGKTTEAKVEKITDFGVFVKLPSGIEALIRKNEIAGGKPRPGNDAPEAPIDVKVGDTIQASVIKVNKKERKVDLSIRRFEKDQERELLRKYSGNQSRLTLGEATGWNSESE